MYIPSLLLHGLRCRITMAGCTFFLRSGFPFFTVAITISPGQAAGTRLSRAPVIETEMMYKFFAPELSAQFMTAATGRPSAILNFVPETFAPAVSQRGNQIHRIEGIWGYGNRSCVHSDSFLKKKSGKNLTKPQKPTWYPWDQQLPPKGKHALLPIINFEFASRSMPRYSPRLDIALLLLYKRKTKKRRSRFSPSALQRFVLPAEKRKGSRCIFWTWDRTPNKRQH